MKLKKCYILMPVLVIALTSCGKRGIDYISKDINKYFLDDYSTTYNNKKGFNIIQLSDTHIGNMCDRATQYKFMQKTIDESNKYLRNKYKDENLKADFLIVTGDLFTFGTRNTTKEYFAFLDKQEIPWTVCFGNHDEQAYYSIDWLTGYLNELNQKRINSKNKNKLESYCVFNDLQDDNVFGNSNFVINIKDETGTLIENMYVLDSNRYNFKYNGYDSIHDDQINWFNKVVQHSTPAGGEVPQGLTFFHIPLPEFNDAVGSDGKIKEGYEFLKDDDGTRELNLRGQGASSTKRDYDTHFYNNLKDANIRGVFVGHNHINGWAAKEKEKNLVFSFGVKSTDTVDHDDNSTGGQLIMINPDRAKLKDNNFTIHQVLHKYSELDKEVK